MKTYVISVEECKDRRATLEERLNSGGIYDYEIFNATIPNSNNDSEIVKLTGREWHTEPRLKNMRKNNARKACYLSHLKVMKHAIDNGINEALILEDDILLNTDITTIINTQPKDAVMSFMDTTLVKPRKYRSYKADPTWVGDWLLLNNKSGVRCWCSGACYYTNIKLVYNHMISNIPKSIDLSLIDYIQKDFITYVYLPKTKLIYQDRKHYKSGLDIADA